MVYKSYGCTLALHRLYETGYQVLYLSIYSLMSIIEFVILVDVRSILNLINVFGGQAVMVAYKRIY